MKITNHRLEKIVKEEITHAHEMKLFNESVREAYSEQLLLNYPNVLLECGYISKTTYHRAKRMKLLSESGRIDLDLQEGFFDDVKAMTKKVSDKALKKGKELGKSALAKAKEVGDTEIDVKGASKEMKRVGKEAGELAAGTGEAMLNFMGPMAKKLGDKAAKFAKKKLKQIDKNGPKAMAAISKHIGNAVDATLSKSKKAAGSGVKGLADLIVKAKEGLTFEQMAKKEPVAFMATYKALEQKVVSMKIKGINTPKSAEATLGIFQSPDGQKALAAAAKKTSMSAPELETILGLYVFQARYVPIATKAAAQMQEALMVENQINRLNKMKITKRQLRRIIKEEKQKLVEYSEHQSYSDISDHLEDMQEMFDDVMIKYVDSNWLEAPAQDNDSLARDLEALYEQLNKMSHIFSQLAGHGRRLS